MKTKHTEGKWVVKWDNSTYARIENEKGILVAEINPYRKTGNLQIPFEEYNANAKILAAAPELLNELIWEVDFLEGLLKDGLKMQDAHRSTIKSRINILKQATS